MLQSLLCAVRLLLYKKLNVIWAERECTIVLRRWDLLGIWIWLQSLLSCVLSPVASGLCLVKQSKFHCIRVFECVCVWNDNYSQIAAVTLWGRMDVLFVAVLLRVRACTRACFHSGTLPSFSNSAWVLLSPSLSYLNLSLVFIPFDDSFTLSKAGAATGFPRFEGDGGVIRSCWREALPAAALWHPVLPFLFSAVVLLHVWWYVWGSDVSAVPFSLLLSQFLRSQWNGGTCCGLVNNALQCFHIPGGLYE